MILCIRIDFTPFHSGTTWVQEIVWQTFHEGQVDSTNLMERVPLLEGATHPSAPDINTLPSPRILKSHLTYDIIPKSANEDSKCKYIYVARNPKDVAVSFFNFLTDLERFKGPWEFFVKLFLEGNGKFIKTLEKVLRQVKTSDIISRRFGDFMTPLSRVQMRIKLTNASLRVTTDLHSGGGYTNTLVRIESVCTFKLGVNCLM